VGDTHLRQGKMYYLSVLHDAHTEPRWRAVWINPDYVLRIPMAACLAYCKNLALVLPRFGGKRGKRRKPRFSRKSCRACALCEDVGAMLGVAEPEAESAQHQIVAL
jgi:Pyruvate/2-oxoacid:ferredoxin oxidoreductase delta subunit